MTPQLRYQVKQLYKELLYMGREYPLGYHYFRTKLHAGFMKNKGLTLEEDIKKRLEFGEYIKKELEALYFLKRYRAIKRSYYD